MKSSFSRLKSEPLVIMEKRAAGNRSASAGISRLILELCPKVGDGLK
jgi:hypothetical protein